MNVFVFLKCLQYDLLLYQISFTFGLIFIPIPTMNKDPNPAPLVGRYRIPALLDAPRRLFRPDSLCSITDQGFLTSNPSKLGSPGTVSTKLADASVNKVRGVGRQRLCDIKLDEVIAGRYTSPLTLKDFEDYLCFVQKNAENLYFELWIRQYSTLYRHSTPSLRSKDEIATLNKWHQLAVDTFFSSDSPLELNVSSDLRRELDTAFSSAKLSALQHQNYVTEKFLPPAAFERVRFDVKESLAITYKQFLQHSTRNADRNRGWFAQFLGGLTWCFGLIPTIVCCVMEKNRAWRVLGLPLWWFGTVVFVGGYKKTCLVVYLFGDNRQLYAWELAREKNGSSCFQFHENDTEWGIGGGGGGGGAPFKGSPDFQDKLDFFSGDGSVTEIGSRDSSRRSSGTFPELHYFPLTRQSSTSDVSVSESTTQTLYFAPSEILKDLPKSAPTWAPFTRVMSPLVCREQRDNVVKAAGFGVVVMILTAAICFSVPNEK